jgi:hypothetical protein
MKIEIYQAGMSVLIGSAQMKQVEERPPEVRAKLPWGVEGTVLCTVRHHGQRERIVVNTSIKRIGEYYPDEVFVL